MTVETETRVEKPAHLKYNDLAPDLKVTTGTGERIQLSSLWAEKPVLLAFTRHFGCPHCKEMLSQLVESKADIEESDLTIAAVTQGTPAEALTAPLDLLLKGVLSTRWDKPFDGPLA